MGGNNAPPPSNHELNAPSQMNERQSSHETWTLVAALGVELAADEDAAAEFPDAAVQGPPPPAGGWE